jgi:hypothetical protein
VGNSRSSGVQRSRFDLNLILAPARRPLGMTFLLAFLERVGRALDQIDELKSTDEGYRSSLSSLPLHEQCSD